MIKSFFINRYLSNRKTYTFRSYAVGSNTESKDGMNRPKVTEEDHIIQSVKTGSYTFSVLNPVHRKKLVL